MRARPSFTSTPRGPSGEESLLAVDATLAAVRRACPGTLVGVSTGAWIEGDERLTRSAIAGWRTLPDYASVNLSEAHAPAIITLLQWRGIGIEAGLSCVADAQRLLGLPDQGRVFRILIEIEEQETAAACRLAVEIAEVLEHAGIQRPLLAHGCEATVWPLIELARQRRWSTRIGLEDGRYLPDGALAPDNAALVEAAVRAVALR